MPMIAHTKYLMHGRRVFDVHWFLFLIKLATSPPAAGLTPETASFGIPRDV
jgi:hypothetical protein